MAEVCLARSYTENLYNGTTIGILACCIDAVLGQKFGDIYNLPLVFDAHSLSLCFCDIGDVRQLPEMDMKKVYQELKEKSSKKMC